MRYFDVGGAYVSRALRRVLSQKLVLQRPSRPNTKPATIAECLVADATGCIILTARNEQGDFKYIPTYRLDTLEVDLMEEGQYLTLRNAKVDMYKGSMRLAVNQWGVIEKAPPGTNFEVKQPEESAHEGGAVTVITAGLSEDLQEDLNLSQVEYELVRIDAAAPEGEAAPSAEQPSPS